MKRLILSAAVISIFAAQANAQDKEPAKEKGFKKENLFVGGSVQASFFSGGTILGINPMFGYKLSNWVDAGAVFNYVYSGQRDVIYLNDKLRQHVYGPGAFMRIYPVRMLFLQGQFEHNFTNVHYSDVYGTKQKFKYDANSLLVGGGFAQGRDPSSNTFYYICLLVDVLKNKNSPYVDNVYNNGVLVRTDLVPIVRAGVNVGLFEKRYRDNEGDNGHRRPRNYERY
jgi:hypothetical protein